MVIAHEGAGIAPVLEAALALALALAPAPHEAIKGAPLTDWVPAVAVLPTKAAIAVASQVKVIVVAIAGAVGIMFGQARPGIIGLIGLKAEGAVKEAQAIRGS